MTGAELLALFRRAPWKTAEEAEAFAAAEPRTAPADLVKLLELLENRALRENALAHRLRLIAFARLAQKSGDRGLFLPLVRSLKVNDDAALRATLVQVMPSVNSPPGHAELLALLRTADRQLRAHVAALLPALGARSAFETLTAMLGEPDFPGRLEAMDAAVAIGGARAIPALRAVLEIGTPQERARALRHLATGTMVQAGRAATLAALAVALDDANDAVQAQAIGAYATLADEDEFFARLERFLDHPSPSLAKPVVENLGRFRSARSLEALRRVLRSAPTPVRVAALGALEAIGGEEALPPLLEALSHGRASVRTRAAEAVGRLGRAGSVDLMRAVVFLLRSREVTIRRMAVEILQSVRDPEGKHWPRLLGYLRDEDWWVRERVLDALLELAGAALLPHVVVFLNDPSVSLRRFAVDALNRLKAPASLGALVRTATGDEDWWVRERAVAAIGAVRDQRATPYIVDIMINNPDLRVACLDALTAMGATSAAAHVVALLPSEDADVCLAALRFLRSARDAQHDAVVRELFGHTRPTVRALAREVLHEWAVAGAPEAPSPGKRVPLDQLLAALIRVEGDDLILKAGYQPFVKRHGKTLPIANNVLSADQVKALLMPLLSMTQVEELRALRDVDLSHQLLPDGVRFRVNVFQEVGGLAAVFRIVKGALLSLDSLGLPPIVSTFKDFKSGLVLAGGPTGAGKSTTLAALIDSINRTSARHVICLEDPIEVAHRRKLSLVNQREIGSHTRSFDEALRATLREDPDVILVGEMRDYPTISFAVTAAETGHLVFGTIHTTSASASVDRLITACPASQQDDVRAMLAGSLRAVVCQFLLSRRDGPGRVLAVEVMINNDAIANLIRKSKTFQIPSVVASSREAGMQSMDSELQRLCREGTISAEDAYLKAASKKDFEALLAEAAAAPPATPPPVSS